MAETEEGAEVGALRYVLCGESRDPGKVESRREPRSQSLCSAGERPGERQVVGKKDQSISPCRRGSGPRKFAFYPGSCGRRTSRTQALTTWFSLASAKVM